MTFNTENQERREGQVKEEAEVGVTQPQAEESPEPPELEEAEGPSPRAFGGRAPPPIT